MNKECKSKLIRLVRSKSACTGQHFPPHSAMTPIISQAVTDRKLVREPFRPTSLFSPLSVRGKALSPFRLHPFLKHNLISLSLPPPPQPCPPFLPCLPPLLFLFPLQYLPYSGKDIALSYTQNWNSQNIYEQFYETIRWVVFSHIYYIFYLVIKWRLKKMV